MTRGEVSMNCCFRFCLLPSSLSSTTNKVPMMGMVHVCQGDLCSEGCDGLGGRKRIINREMKTPSSSHLQSVEDCGGRLNACTGTEWETSWVITIHYEINWGISLICIVVFDVAV